MGIRFLCPNGHKLNVKTELAGKRAVCPECGAKLMIPAASAPLSAPSSGMPPAAVVVAAPPQGAVAWHLRSTTGEQQGPLSELQFRASIAAGRVTAETLVWREGWPEWKPARSVAELLPTPLVAMPIATAAAAVPVEPLPILAEIFPSASAEILADPLVEKPLVDDAAIVPADADKSPALAASTYIQQRRRSKQKQLTLAIAMLLAVVVLAGVLVWVVNLSSAPTTEMTSPNSASSTPSPTVSR
jgi:hypothetical protein